jgi:hypothetical protein
MSIKPVTQKTSEKPQAPTPDQRCATVAASVAARGWTDELASLARGGLVAALAELASPGIPG